MIKNRFDGYFVGLDFSNLDNISPASGQYRYIINLVRGLSEINQNEIKFVLFGSRPCPVYELTDIFQYKSDYWSYKQIKPWNFKGSYYLNHIRYPAIIHACRIHLWHILHEFVPFFACCKFVKTEYDLMYELFDEYKEAIYSRPYRIKKWATIHRVDHVICISQTTACDLIERWRLKPYKISVIPLGTEFLNNESRLPSSDIAHLPEKCLGLTILSPFNLEPRKNLRSLIFAMPPILKKYPNLRLILFGQAAWTAERNAEFKRLISELKIEDKIIYTGIVRTEDLTFLYQWSTLFVFPSLYEGFGLPVLEAMSKGACVIARKASSMAEIVNNAGFLIEPCDSNNLSKSIIKLLEDDLLRKQLGEKARQRVKEFSIQKMAIKTWQVYKQLLKI